MRVPPLSVPRSGGFAVLAALGMGLRLLLIWGGWSDHMIPTDDAYYYFTIARNLVTGHGVSFDGLTPTNGFHPLWMIMVAPLFAVADALKTGPWFPVRAALTLCALFDLATGRLLFGTLARLGRPVGARWAAAMWFLFPTHILLSLQGLEGAVTATVIALHAWMVVRLSERFEITAKSGALMGAVAGLAFLARTDNGLLVPLAMVAETAVPASSGRLRWRRAPGFLLAGAAMTVVIASPWLAWNLATFKTPFQVSGAIKMLSPHLGGHIDAAVAAHHLPAAMVQFIALGEFLWRPIQFALGGYLGARWPAVMGLAAFEVLVLALLLSSAMRRLRSDGPTGARALAIGLGIYLVAHMVVYALAARFYANWYASAPALIVQFVFVGLGADALLAGWSPARRRALAACSAVLGVVLFSRFFAVAGIHPRGPELAARWAFKTIAERAPAVRTIGCFHGSTGAWGYFAPFIGPYRVVNLDGVVNNRVLESFRQGRYFEYLDRTVDLVAVNAPVPFEYLLGPAGTERFRVTFPSWGDGSDYYGPRRIPSPGRSLPAALLRGDAIRREQRVE